MMTEEEAKTKWCPLSRCAGEINGHVVGGANRLGEPWQCSPFVQQTMCIGSACMAWRAVTQWETKIGERDQKPEGDGWEWDTFSDDRWERQVPTGKGYCGLAGRPE